MSLPRWVPFHVWKTLHWTPDGIDRARRCRLCGAWEVWAWGRWVRLRRDES